MATLTPPTIGGDPRFTISDYVHAGEVINDARGSAPAGSRRHPPTPLRGGSYPLPLGPGSSTTSSPTSPVSPHGPSARAVNFHMPTPDPLGPGPRPYPGSPEPSFTSSSPAASPPLPMSGSGLTYPPRAYPGGGRDDIGLSASHSAAGTPGFGSTGMLVPERTGATSDSYLTSQYTGDARSITSSRLGGRPPMGRSAFSDYDKEDDEKLAAAASHPEKVTGVAPVLKRGFSVQKSGRSKFLDRFFPDNWACRLLIVVVFLETIIDICIQANLLWRYDKEVNALEGLANSHRLKYFLVVFIIAHFTQLTLTIWAVYTRNIIQIAGLAIFNLLLLGYAAIQIGEVATVLGSTPEADAETSHSIFSLPTKILSGLVIAVVATAEVAICVLSWYVWREFGWRIYRHLGADLAVRRRYRQYQIFECTLCFSAFFFVGFGVQFLFLVLDKNDPEFYITILMVPLALVWLVLGAFAGRKELTWLMSIFLVGMLGGVAYFIFKTVRIWTQPQGYEGVQKSLTIFTIFSLAMIALCFVFAVIVWTNFGKGLKEAVRKSRPARRGRVEDAEPSSYAELGPVPHERLTIE